MYAMITIRTNCFETLLLYLVLDLLHINLDLITNPYIGPLKCVPQNTHLVQREMVWECLVPVPIPHNPGNLWYH